MFPWKSLSTFLEICISNNGLILAFHLKFLLFLKFLFYNNVQKDDTLNIKTFGIEIPTDYSILRRFVSKVHILNLKIVRPFFLDI